MSAWAKRAGPIAGAALALIAVFFLSANTCAAQQHKPLEPRQSPAAHHDAVALGGPTHGPATPAAGARFPIVPAGVVLTKAPATSRPTRRLASNEVGASGRPAPNDDEPTLYLIAFKDHTIVQALGYWMEGGALHYVSVEHTLNQVSLDLLDRDLSQRLNDERGVQFKLPAR